MIAPASFYETAYDQQTQTSYLLELDLSKVFFNPADRAQVGLGLVVSEGDSFGSLEISLRPIAAMASVSKAFSFLGIPLTAYLNYDPTVVASASLNDFSLAADFVTP
jgi:hypothetical protein